MITPEQQVKNVQDFIEMSWLSFGGRPFPMTTDHLKILLSMPKCSNASCSCRVTAGDVFIDLNERYSLNPASLGD
jgi:hypothetical protein